METQKALPTCELCERPIDAPVCTATVVASSRKTGAVLLTINAAHEDCIRRWLRIVEEEYANG